MDQGGHRRARLQPGDASVRKYVTDVPHEVDIICPALDVALAVCNDITSYVEIGKERRHTPDMHQTAQDAWVAGHHNSGNAPEI